MTRRITSRIALAIAIASIMGATWLVVDKYGAPSDAPPAGFVH